MRLHWPDGVTDHPERLRIVILAPNENAYSETFIGAHIERLPGPPVALYGGYIPTPPYIPSESMAEHTVKALRDEAAMLAEDDKHIKLSALTAYLRQCEADVVLAEYGPTGASCLPSCLRAGVPMVAHFHGYDAYDLALLKDYESQYRKLVSAAAALVVPSVHMREQLIAIGAPGKKVFINRYGVDTALFCGADPATAPPILLAVGRFVEKKAPQLTIQAFSQVARLAPAAKLLMVGDGPLLPSCRKLAHELALQDKVLVSGCPAAQCGQSVNGRSALFCSALRPNLHRQFGGHTCGNARGKFVRPSDHSYSPFRYSRDSRPRADGFIDRRG